MRKATMHEGVVSRFVTLVAAPRGSTSNRKIRVVALYTCVERFAGFCVEKRWSDYASDVDWTLGSRSRLRGNGQQHNEHALSGILVEDQIFTRRRE